MKIFQRFSRIATLVIFALNVATIGAMDLAPKSRLDRDFDHHSIGALVHMSPQGAKSFFATKTNEEKGEYGEKEGSKIIEKGGTLLRFSKYLKANYPSCARVVHEQLTDMKTDGNHGIDHFFVPIVAGTKARDYRRKMVVAEMKSYARGDLKKKSTSDGYQMSSSWTAAKLTRKIALLKTLKNSVREGSQLNECARSARKVLKTALGKCGGCNLIRMAAIFGGKGFFDFHLIYDRGATKAAGLRLDTAAKQLKYHLPKLFAKKDLIAAQKTSSRRPAAPSSRRRSVSIGDVNHLAARLARTVRVSKHRGRRH